MTEDVDLRNQAALAVLHALPFPMVLWAAVRDEHSQIVDCRYLDCNAAAIEYLRLSKSELLGRRMAELFHGAAAETALGWARQAIESKQPLVLDDQTLPSAVTGDERRFSISMTPAQDTVMFMWRDVTAQYDSEQALRASEETLRVVMQSAPVAMNLTAPDGTFIRVNPAMSAFLRRDEPTLMQTTWQAITHPDDLAEDLALARAVARGEQDSYRLTKRFIRPDGSEVWGDLAVSAVRDAAGEFQFYIAQIVDVSELVKKREDLTRSQDHYRLLAENTSDVVLRVEGTRVAWVSPSVAEVLGWRPADVLGRPIEDFLDPEQRAAVLTAMRTEDSAPDRHASGQFRVLCQDGAWLWVDASARWAANSEQLPVTVVRLRNVHDEVRARAALAASEERLRTAMQAAPIGMALADNHGLITQANPALCDLLGRGSDDLVGLHVSALSHPDDRGIDDEMWTALNSSQASAVTREKRLADSQGHVVWVHNAIAAARDDQGTVANYVVQFLDVTQHRLAAQALDELAHHDPLTGLKNRRAVLEHVVTIMAQSPSPPIATLFIDVDRFKNVNDSYGHGVGDALLAAIAKRIVSCLRFGDAVGRIGGDEFLIVLHGVNDLAASLEVADKVRRAVAEPLVIDGLRVHPTISLGVSLPRAGDTPDSLIARADRALYEAKETGRNRVAISD